MVWNYRVVKRKVEIGPCKGEWHYQMAEMYYYDDEAAQPMAFCSVDLGNEEGNPVFERKEELAACIENMKKALDKPCIVWDYESERLYEEKKHGHDDTA